MSGTTAPVWVEVWSLTVITPDSSFGPNVTLHTTERDALDALIENFDPEREFAPVPTDPDDYDGWIEEFEAFFNLQHVEVDKHHVSALMVEERR